MSSQVEPYPAAADEMPIYWQEGMAGSFCTPKEVRWLRWKAAQSTGNLLEIGTYVGGCTRELALQCPDKTVHSVDWLNPAGPVHLCDQQKPEMLSEDRIGQLADQKNVHLWDMDSKTFRYAPFNIGFVFIDGDHSYEGVKADTELALKSFREMPRPFTIVWHDYGIPGWPDVKRYLDDSGLSITHVEGTWIAYLDLEPDTLTRLYQKAYSSNA